MTTEAKLSSASLRDSEKKTKPTDTIVNKIFRKSRKH